MRVLLLALVLAACGGSSPNSGPSPSPSPSPTPAPPGLRLMTAEEPLAECPSPSPTANPPAADSAALPGEERCYRLDEALLVVPSVEDAVVTEQGGAVLLTITVPDDMHDDLEQATSKVVNRDVALVFEGRVLVSAPVRSPLGGGQFVVTGLSSRAYAEQVAAKLKAL